MCSVNFVKGMGIGLIVGSAIGMAVCSCSTNSSDSSKSHKRKSVVGKALKTMGEVVENIGDSLGL